MNLNRYTINTPITMLPFARQYLSDKCKVQIKIGTNYCPCCLEPGQTQTVRKPDWGWLMNNGRVQPAQVLNAYNPSDGSLKAVINLSSPGQACAKCTPMCWICQTDMCGPTVCTESQPDLRVHRACAVKCSHIVCTTYLETVPCFIPFGNISKCEKHSGDTKSQGPINKGLVNSKSAKPLESERAKKLEKTERIERVISPTKTIKKKTSSLVEQRLAKLNSGCKSPSVKSFFGGSATQSAPKTFQRAEPARKADEASKNFLYTKDTGDAYAYLMDDKWYKISNDEPLHEVQEVLYCKKFDFSPPAVEPLQANGQGAAREIPAQSTPAQDKLQAEDGTLGLGPSDAKDQDETDAIQGNPKD